MSEALLVSLRVTALAVPAILILGLAGGVLLARVRGNLRFVLETLVLVPVLIPPTVVGYGLLHLLGRNALLAQLTGLELLFTMAGAAVAATVMGLPLMIITCAAAVRATDPRLESVARTLGAGEWRVLREITLPLARRGIIAGLLLAAARAFGEFGATLMVAGAMPGKTRTLSIALYEATQTGDDATALGIVLLLTAVTVTIVAVLRWLEARGARP